MGEEPQWLQRTGRQEVTTELWLESGNDKTQVRGHVQSTVANKGDACPESDTWLNKQDRGGDSIRCYSGTEQAAGLGAEAYCRVVK